MRVIYFTLQIYLFYGIKKNFFHDPTCIALHIILQSHDQNSISEEYLGTVDAYLHSEESYIHYSKISRAESYYFFSAPSRFTRRCLNHTRAGSSAVGRIYVASAFSRCYLNCSQRIYTETTLIQTRSE